MNKLKISQYKNLIEHQKIEYINLIEQLRLEII